MVDWLFALGTQMINIIKPLMIATASINFIVNRGQESCWVIRCFGLGLVMKQEEKKSRKLPRSPK